MTTKFLLFCETCTESGSPVRYLNGIIEGMSDLQDRMVYLHSIGVKVFKAVPILVDEQSGKIELKCYEH